MSPSMSPSESSDGAEAVALWEDTSLPPKTTEGGGLGSSVGCRVSSARGTCGGGEGAMILLLAPRRCRRR